MEVGEGLQTCTDRPDAGRSKRAPVTFAAEGAWLRLETVLFRVNGAIRLHEGPACFGR
jgi:hypothetical protein